jgi:hypothetical protein
LKNTTGLKESGDSFKFFVCREKIRNFRRICYRKTCFFSFLGYITEELKNNIGDFCLWIWHGLND